MDAQIEESLWVTFGKMFNAIKYEKILSDVGTVFNGHIRGVGGGGTAWEVGKGGSVHV